MTGEFRAGWQVRRSVPKAQECPGDENGGKTWGDWYSCCPKGTFPKGSGEDRWCDDGKGTAGNSTAHPQCASSKWSLFTLNDYYFCCDAGSEDRGYYYANTDYYYFGCASNDWISNDAGRDVRRADSFPNPPAASSTPTSSSTSESPSTNKGAIAGGVVGGVCGALIIVGTIWFLCRRRRSKIDHNNEGAPTTWSSPSLHPGAHYESVPNELGDNRHEPSEVDGSIDRKEVPATTEPRHEMPGDTPRPN